MARNALRAAGVVAMFVGLLVAGAAAVPLTPSTGATYQFHCVSAFGSSDSSYDVSASAPSTVVQGDVFTLADVVITGTPDTELLIKHVDFNWSVTPNATPLAPFVLSIDGPGALVPPGPPAPPGVPQSSSPQSYDFTATGAIGSVIDFGIDSVSAVVLNPGDTSQETAVTCTYVSGPPFASTEIVAPPETTSTSTSTSTSTTSTTEAPTSTTASTTSTTIEVESSSTSSTTSSTLATTSTTVAGEGVTVPEATTTVSSSPLSATGEVTSAPTVAPAASGTTLPFTGSSRAPASLGWLFVGVGLACFGLSRPRRHA